MNIDWSKAPSWVIGYALHAFGGEISEVWVGEHQYQRLDQPKPFPYGGGNSDHRHNSRRSEFHFEQLRPTPWTGEGLPPVGTVCEYRVGDGTWFQCEIRYVTSPGPFETVEVVMYPPHLKGEQICEVGTGPGKVSFRPIRTPEQMAAEEREAGIKAIHAMLDNCIRDLRGDAEALWDAGYRKQPAP